METAGRNGLEDQDGSDGAMYELVAMKAFCARVPRNGSTGIARAYDCGIEEEYQGMAVKRNEQRRMMTGDAVQTLHRAAYAMSALSIASPTESSSSQRNSTAPNTFLYHSSLSVFASSFTAFIPISALFVTTAHISLMLSLQACSFSSDTTSAYPRMVSLHCLEAVAISSSDPPSVPAGKLWCSLSAVIRRKEVCAGEGEQWIVQSLP